MEVKVEGEVDGRGPLIGAVVGLRKRRGSFREGHVTPQTTGTSLTTMAAEE